MKATQGYTHHRRGRFNGECRRRRSREVSLRRLPFPYRSMLAICSDLDETPDRRVNSEIMRFLNTTENTCMGRASVGGGQYHLLRHAAGPVCLLEHRRRRASHGARSDTIGSHRLLSFLRRLATTREHARRALDELSRHDCPLEVWVDHSAAPSNFGADIMRGWGCRGLACVSRGSRLRLRSEYVWRGRVTSVIGQDVPRRLGGIWNWAIHSLPRKRC